MGGIVTGASDRFSRQADLVPRDQLEDQMVTVIGVGAIGRQVAIQLASMGVKRLQLIDFDVVETTNVTTQGYRSSEIGEAKVVATMLEVERIDSSIEQHYIIDRFRPTQTLGEVVFCCVDSISARAAIWRSMRSRCKLWVDGRMLGEVIRVLSATELATDSGYESTLFDQSNAQAGSCTSKSTIYTASIAAGLMVHQFTRWLRDLPLEQDLVLNLLASELVIQ
ncbi:ThiF family adenylyltransferase [Roseimaritima ulvae]|uniref:Molybdopterin-synthase adenylyltransferase n=1 Tax=Roseimaritima ulvae TaxID=980254 RepID=A0A5B9QW57_9BACT|nr:ThiF family adenylyltransferase [Roseimaritima ulvae]QEG41326.1 Molybdopterin-synthase adenylyltransferase [Roseimaritima ulvae]